jgi:hypothetical protein
VQSIPASVGIPAACLVLAALAIVVIQVWRRVTKAPPVQESQDARRRRLRAAYRALGVGIATVFIGFAFPGAAPRSFAAWLFVVFISFGPLLISIALLWRWARGGMDMEEFQAAFSRTDRAPTSGERSARLRFIVGFVVLVVALSLAFQWSLDHVTF